MKKVEKYPKALLWAGAIIFVLVVLLAWFDMSGRGNVRFSESQAQSQIDQHLPLDKDLSVFLIPFGISVRDVIVHFEEGNQVHVMAVGEIRTARGNAEVEVDSVGYPQYRDGAFFFALQNFEITKFEVDEQGRENLATAGRVLKGVLERHLGGVLKDARAKVDARKLAGRIEAKAADAIEQALAKHLARHPIYKFDGAKGKILKLAIDKVEVQSSELVISFSLIRLTLTVVLIVLGALVGLAAVMTAPWWAQSFMWF